MPLKLKLTHFKITGLEGIKLKFVRFKHSVIEHINKITFYTRLCNVVMKYSMLNMNGVLFETQ